MNALVECKSCRAKFDPTIQWAYGWRDDDRTDDNFHVSGRIPLGNCPVCRTPQESASE